MNENPEHVEVDLVAFVMMTQVKHVIFEEYSHVFQCQDPQKRRINIRLAGVRSYDDAHHAVKRIEHYSMN